MVSLPLAPTTFPETPDETIRRLTAELREARDRQRAASAVLEAIARSPADTRPVFEAIVDNATRLCRAEFTAVARFDGGLLHLVAINNLSTEEQAAFHSLFPRPPARNFAMGRTFLEGRPVQFADMLAEPDYDPRTREALQSVIQYRSFLGVPIRREGRPIGVIGCGRRQAEPATEAEIAILETFADQAAIALENARLIAQTQEALEQQTATAEVLQVINSSPGDLTPVFDAVLEKAVTLSEAVYGHLWRFDGEHFHPWRSHGDPQFARWFEHLGPGRPNPDGDGFLGRVVRGEHVLYIADVRNTEAYRTGYASVTGLADVGGGRSVLTVALRKDQAVLGVLTVYRREVKQFSEKQISLLQNFAA